MNFVNSKKSPLSKKFDVAHGVDRAGCRISERTVRFKQFQTKTQGISKFSLKFP